MLIMKSVIKLILEGNSYLCLYTAVSASHLPSSSKHIFRENRKVDIHIFSIYLLSVSFVLGIALGAGSLAVIR